MSKGGPSDVFDDFPDDRSSRPSTAETRARTRTLQRHSSRAEAAVRLMHLAARAAPVPQVVASPRWVAHGPLLIPAAIRVADLAHDLRRHALTDAEPTVLTGPPVDRHAPRAKAEAPLRSDIGDAASSVPYAVLTSRVATRQHRCRAFLLDAPLPTENAAIGSAIGAVAESAESAHETPCTSRSMGATATMVVHARRAVRRPRLATAASTQELFHRAWATGQVDDVASPPGQPGRVWRTGPVRAPRVMAHGRTRAVEWLLEEHVRGSLITRDDRAEAAWQLASALGAVWSAHVTHRRARPRPWAAQQVSWLLDEPVAAGLTDHPRQLMALRNAVLCLGNRSLVVAHGPRHGDPVLGNVLRTTDGHLVLLDWELAGPGLLATDLVKVALALPTIEQGWHLLEDTAPTALENTDHHGPTAASWRDQVALTLMVWLSGWRTQRRTHHRSGRADTYDRRLRRRLALLAAALNT